MISRFSIITAVLLTLTACSGDDDSPMASAPAQELLQSDAVQDDPEQCSAPAFDVAEFLFTESDRQWFCNVTADTLVTQDQVFFSRNGTAAMTRFRDVFWNRSMADQSISVASPFISPFVIRNITSSNTIMAFDLVTEGGRTEAYDCVLVGREVTAPEII